ncbi:DUF1722 domain-containing protein [Liquorilactobacillus satsumensis]|uniref:DUF1722 domain-containing protein n=1 Tax=Liquorilactobacillus satsumensis DSM 16230 = JCM 12392 TaxID=1423801 RepID=A0A0R1V3Q4_9LACO|nr:DUF1722 domain-containing protein [Liquorilactobacillus satsumensis]KRL97666.1 hypothetical protein FD50_GL001231 [Liquorilactobacillus satsumensis DSM 16230 = JCM 12392]MCP9312040.1 DUF1722 domain-containing protein [Liquorilactobacillus satsumensis]MCP9329625.1 DUF1722 domain-containing protein [Liquorilactobacillus satsumensis]MCP9357473.1 DUF1722 domain-containing protein [Liquorilactobacillus satsumensis]MCP9359174.1 DUF1722 domain-containing protein [Liquorilactobacillus satsumensis]
MLAWQESWAEHKYWVMSRSQQFYNEIRMMAANNDWTETKEKKYQELLQQAEALKPTTATLTTAYQHVWGYFKKCADSTEKKKYLDYLNVLTPENDQLGPFLTKLTFKYHVAYLEKARLILQFKEVK